MSPEAVNCLLLPFIYNLNETAYFVLSPVQLKRTGGVFQMGPEDTVVIQGEESMQHNYVPNLYAEGELLGLDGPALAQLHLSH